MAKIKATFEYKVKLTQEEYDLVILGLRCYGNTANSVTARTLEDTFMRHDKNVYANEE